MALPFYIPPPPPGSNDEQRKAFNEFVKGEFGGSEDERPKEGDLRVETLYAWWPKEVCDKTIWLKSYQQLFEFKTRSRLTYLYGLGVLQWHGSGWDLISEKIL